MVDDVAMADAEKTKGEEATTNDAEMTPEAKKVDEAVMKENETAEGEIAEEANLEEAKESKEREQDAPVISGTRLQAGSVTFLPEDTTINVLPVAEGKLLFSLKDGGFQYLLSGARANTGIVAGRYMFEVMIASSNSADPNDQLDADQQGVKAPRPWQIVKVGLSTNDAPLLLSDGEDSVCFDSEGYFTHGNRRLKVSQRFVHNQVVAVVLNLDPTSPNSNTVSLFRDGIRVAEPQPLPETLKGKVLYPAVTYRNVTLRVNFGTTPLRPLPFKCLTLMEAVQEHCETKVPANSAGEKCQVVVPIGLPDEGTFDWLDMFLNQNKGYVEISDRAILDWACKSGVQRPGGYSRRSENDNPKHNFSLPLMERIISTVAPALQRNYVIMEAKGNMMAEERTEKLARFAGPDFKKVAQVVMGEPPAAFKDYVQQLLLKDKTVKAKAEVRRKKAEATEKKSEKASTRQAEGSKQRIPKEDTNVMEPELEEETMVELTEDEKKMWFRKEDVPDLTSSGLAEAYPKFTLPEQAEGFDEVTYLWQNEAQCKDYLRAWVLEKKRTQRVEKLEPSDMFKAKWAAWTKLLTTWTRKHKEFKEAHELVNSWIAAEAKKEPEKEAPAMETNNGGLEDVFAVADIMDIGDGEPLFGNFVYEDWQLLSLRFEVHLLLHAFKHDLDDPERTTFHERHFEFYYNKYYKKTISLKHFGVAKLSDLVELITDIVNINPQNSCLEAQLADDTPMDKFVKLTEDHRRSRQRRVEAGDETAQLEFMKPSNEKSTRPAQGRDRPAAASGGRPALAPALKRPPPSSSGHPPAQRPRTDYRGGAAPPAQRSRTDYRGGNSYSARQYSPPAQRPRADYRGGTSYSATPSSYNSSARGGDSYGGSSGRYNDSGGSSSRYGGRDRR